MGASRPENDRSLVRGFLATRSERAFRRLYGAHTPALYLFALRLTGGDAAEAEDVVQETWLRAVPRLGGFRWQSSLRTWLHGVAINVYREGRRRRSTADSKTAELRASLTVVATPPRSTVDLERALVALPAGGREVLLLHDVEGYTHKEIGALLGIEEGTSKSQLSRARQSMRARLEGRTGESNAR